MIPKTDERPTGPGCGDRYLEEAAGGQGEPAGVWDAEQEYPYQDHYWLFRFAEPSVGGLTSPNWPQLPPELLVQLQLRLGLWLLQPPQYQLLKDRGCED